MPLSSTGRISTEATEMQQWKVFCLRNTTVPVTFWKLQTNKGTHVPLNPCDLMTLYNFLILAAANFNEGHSLFIHSEVEKFSRCFELNISWILSVDEESTKEMQLTRFRFFKYESDSKTCIKKVVFVQTSSHLKGMFSHFRKYSHWFSCWEFHEKMPLFVW